MPLFPTKQHGHVFLGSRHDMHERRTWQVVALTAAMMVAEIVGGTLFGSMALVADGWHMSAHAAALALAAVAYRVARKHQHNAYFTFGTGKFGELAAFGNALLLLVIALLIGYESLERLFMPVPIRFAEALPIAVLGLVVNLASAWLLHDHHHHDHDHDHDHHDHGHGHHHDHAHDTNLRAAYVHVLADALTSVLAIAALLAGYFGGIGWVDPIMGLVGTVVIGIWSWNLLKAASRTLLDRIPDPALAARIRDRLEQDGDRVIDFHLWRLGPEHLGLIASIVSPRPQTPDHYKRQLADVTRLAHITIEVHRGTPAT
ncbi:MAG: CDF family Co(II)/Ni(II) efflux transporter DmeF [Pigmentiphaga sp.]|uniref:CDF family Co(II)/Ni(II) efflux transporter DmeF n=1 Tax=Pigmentiphaga sp. TaxID=1977564 RepID=UPI0029BACDF8|nr:CDF family Co(II)/Ni(II) efflux transporter DmeF [Pigmentiphaga sp.]MDX3907323.1 CDF family Co(II)/Ni(II) efflux transporter DmeF [Pigmentiphaga sp.]